MGDQRKSRYYFIFKKVKGREMTYLFNNLFNRNLLHLHRILIHRMTVDLFLMIMTAIITTQNLPGIDRMDRTDFLRVHWLY